MNSWSAAVTIISRCGARAWLPASSPRLPRRDTRGEEAGSQEVVHALKVLVHGSEADVGDVVHLLQLAHHHLADHAAGHFAFTESEDALLDPVDRLVDVLRGNRSFMQCAHKAGADFLAIVGDAIAARFHHHGHRKLD